MSAKGKPKKAGPKPSPAAWKARLTRLAWRAVVAFVLASVGAVLLLRFVDPPTTAFMLQRRWHALTGQDGKFQLRQTWVPLERVSPSMRLAVVSAEDQKFPQHHGFDVEAIADAVEDHLDGKSSRGASTLTQQVAKNLFLWPGHSFVRKGLEAWFTVLLEVLWPKRRILEVHLNVAEYGDGLYGVEAAARTFYGKSAAALSLEESAALATVLPSPRKRKVTAPSAGMKQRAGWIVDQARRLGPGWLEGM